MDEALTTFLLAQSGLTALIGRRIYPDETPPEVDLSRQTAVVYQVVDDYKDHILTGQSKLERPNYQYTAYAPTRAGARAIANQIKAALCDYTGTLSGIFVQYIKLVNELPDTLTTSDGLVKVNTVDLGFEVNFVKE